MKDCGPVLVGSERKAKSFSLMGKKRVERSMDGICTLEK